MKKQLTLLDYALIIISVFAFGVSVILVVEDLPFIAIGGFCAYGCILLTFVQRQLSKPEPAAKEQPEFQELQRQYESNKRAMNVRMNLLTTKVQEKDRELNKYKELYENAASAETPLKTAEIPNHAAQGEE